MGRVVHHYAATHPIAQDYQVQQGARIVSVAWRHASAGPVAYVEKCEAEDKPGAKTHLMKLFFIGTGQEFEQHDLDFLGTVTPDGIFFFHVYGKVFY